VNVFAAVKFATAVNNPAPAVANMPPPVVNTSPWPEPEK
jgi:hypothetical protein